MPGILAALGAYLIGAKTLWRERRAEIVLPVACFLVILLSALATSGKFGAGQTLGSMAKRVSFALPLFYVTQSVGIFTLLRSREVLWRRTGTAMAVVLLGVSIYSIVNYWTGREFLNPNYTAPWSDVVSAMEKTRPLGPDTAVFSRGELALDFYLKGESVEAGTVPNGVLVDNGIWGPDDIARDLAAHPARYVWLVSRDRGDRTAADGAERLNDYLAQKYQQVDEVGVMPRSASELHYFKRFMKRDAAPYYISLTEFDTSRPAFEKKELRP